MRLMLLICSLLMVSCTIVLSKGPDARLNVSWGNHTGRYLSPSLATIELDGTGPDQASFHQTWAADASTGTVDGLVPGTWVLALKVLSTGGSVLQSASATIELQSGDNSTVPLTLDAPQPMGKVAWARVASTTATSKVISVGDGDGGIWAVYYGLTSSTDVGAYADGSRATTSGSDSALVHYDAEGMVLKRAPVTLGTFAWVPSAAVAADGTLYVGGYSNGLDLGGGFSNDSTSIGFVGRFDRAGDCTGLLTYDSTADSDDWVFGVAVDDSGSAYILGGSDTSSVTAFTATLGSFDHVATGGGVAFVAKLGSDLTPDWVCWGDVSKNNEYVDLSSLALGPGTVYVGGYFSNNGAGTSMTLGNTTKPATVTSKQAVLAALDASTGTLKWMELPTQTGESFGPQIAVAPDGTLRTGWYVGSSSQNFGNGVTATKPAESDYLYALVAYDDQGKALWAAEPLKGASHIEDTPFPAVDALGNTFLTLTPTWSGTLADLGDGVTVDTVLNRFDSGLAKYDAAGKAVWAQFWKGNDTIYRVDVDAMGHLNVTGESMPVADGVIDLGNGVTMESQGTNAYVVQFR